MKKLALSLAPVVGCMIVLLSACDLFGGDSGGAGADFDATQYYTKSEIDAKFTSLKIPTRRGEAPKYLGNSFTSYYTGVEFNQAPEADFVVLYLWPNPAMSFTDTDGVFTIYAGGSDADPQMRLASTTIGGQSFFFTMPTAGNLKFWTAGLSGSGDMSAAFYIVPIYYYADN